MKTYKYPQRDTWASLLMRPVMKNETADALVQPIIENVFRRGDEALFEYTAKFDKVNLKSLQVSESEFNDAIHLVDEDLKSAISTAVHNIGVFHTAQNIETVKITTAKGVECWQKSVAIEKVGLYVPGGSAPLFSTVLMLAIPARIAGCKEVILCTPPGKDESIHPAILYAARITGITRVFKIGGAQAIAAMAYGTATIPKVYKIMGPGNQFVTTAKQLVSRGDVAIDMPAGPSELAVFADETSNAAFVASDLLSQAEHGADSQVLLFTTHEEIAELIASEVKRQIETLPRKAIAMESLMHSRIFVLKDSSEAMDMINEYAPEHLILATDKAAELADKVVNAGSVFLGHYAPESAGDYASGTNHTLPTNGYARAYNGTNLDDFVKKITFQHLTAEGLKGIGNAVMKMAEAENLTAHKNAVAIRIKQP
jgi:histidinol dehydrogenase